MNLTDKAMLASLTIRQWSAKKHDRKISQEVASAHGVDVTMGRYNKALVSKSALEKIQKIANQARQDFYFHTLPWKDDGSRILTAAGFYKLAPVVRKHDDAWQVATAELFDNYASYLEAAPTLLGTAYNPADYPSESDLRTKFGFEFRVSPLPEAGDFRVKLADEELSAIRQQITDTVQESAKEGMRDVWGRMQVVVARMADKLNAYKVTDDGVEGVFRDSLVENIRELLDVIPALNLTDDPAIVRFANDMKNLCQFDAETLRENDTIRTSTAKHADEILSKMREFV